MWDSTETLKILMVTVIDEEFFGVWLMILVAKEQKIEVFR